MSFFIHRICHTVILDDPFEDIRGLDYPRKSPEPTDERLQVSYESPFVIIFIIFIFLLK